MTALMTTRRQGASSLSFWLVELQTQSEGRLCEHPLSLWVSLVGLARERQLGVVRGAVVSREENVLQLLHVVTTEQKDCHKMM